MKRRRRRKEVTLIEGELPTSLAVLAAFAEALPSRLSWRVVGQPVELAAGRGTSAKAMARQTLDVLVALARAATARDSRTVNDIHEVALAAFERWDEEASIVTLGRRPDWDEAHFKKLLERLREEIDSLLREGGTSESIATHCAAASMIYRGLPADEETMDARAGRILSEFKRRRIGASDGYASVAACVLFGRDVTIERRDRSTPRRRAARLEALRDALAEQLVPHVKPSAPLARATTIAKNVRRIPGASAASLHPRREATHRRRSRRNTARENMDAFRGGASGRRGFLHFAECCMIRAATLKMPPALSPRR